MAQGRVMVLVFVSHCWYYIVVCVTSGGNQEKAITQIPSGKGVKIYGTLGKIPPFYFIISFNRNVKVHISVIGGELLKK